MRYIDNFKTIFVKFPFCLIIALAKILITPYFLPIPFQKSTQSTSEEVRGKK